MSRKTNPEILITLDKPRRLRFDVNAMATFEELTGLNLLKESARNQIEKDISVKQFRAFLYACLVHEDKTLTLEQVGRLITTDNMQEILDKIGEAKKAAAPEPELEGAKKTRPLVSRSGKSRPG
jgi:hypothetical protein